MSFLLMWVIPMEDSVWIFLKSTVIPTEESHSNY
uniref:Uncharacterized protein n=1 Tax=Anguilla anguilla TaxID=7936 RepID=A0A0E9QZZ4_ANGAN